MKFLLVNFSICIFEHDSTECSYIESCVRGKKFNFLQVDKIKKKKSICDKTQ